MADTPPGAPTPDDIAAACAEIQAEWSDADERDRRYDPPHAAQYHLLALTMGADERRAERLFLGREYRPGRLTVRQANRPQWRR